MFASLQRHVYPSHPPDLMAPHARAVHDHVAGDVTVAAVRALPVHACHATARPGDVGDGSAFLDVRPALPRAPGQRQRDVGRITLPVQRQVNTARDTVDVQVFVFHLDLGGADFLHLDAKGTGHGRLPVQLFQALGRQGGGDRADPFEARCHTCFGFQIAVKLLRIFRQFGHVGRRPQLGDQPSGMPCGA